MASSSKQKTTMAKRDRENRLRERRELKKAKKNARKLEAQAPDPPADALPSDPGLPADELPAPVPADELPAPER